MIKNLIKPIAVIDVGAHSIRLEISQFDSKGNKELLNKMETAIPLGPDVFRKGKISSRNIQLACDIISDCVTLINEYGVKQYEAIATSAVKEASNQDIFINRIKVETDIDLKVLEDSEEMKLIFLAVKNAVSKRFGLQKHNAIICSIGTGSTQLAFIEKGNFKVTQTLKFGTLRLIDEIFNNTATRKLSESIDPFVENVVESVVKMVPKSKPDLFIVVGATVRGLVNIDRKLAPKKIATISIDSFRKLSKKISGADPLELVEDYNLSDSIANGLEPCCNLLEHFFEITNASRLIVPIINTRDVILKKILRSNSGKLDIFTKETISSAKFIGEKYEYDSEHAKTVSMYALQIFDMLKNFHKMDHKERLLLELAGYLHDVGQFISSRKHHKHSYYIINNAIIPGLSPDDQHLLALISRYHRKSPPKNSHIEYRSLSTDKRVTVCKLASILRLADALDRSHKCRIKINKIRHDKSTLKIYVSSKSNDIILEQWSINNKSNMFTDTYGLKVLLIKDNE